MLDDQKEIFNHIQQLKLQGDLKQATEEINHILSANDLNEDEKFTALLLKSSISNRQGNNALA